MGIAAPLAPLKTPPKTPPRTVERFFEFSLLGMLASGYFAVATSGYLDWPTAVLTLAALCFRAMMAAGVVHTHIPGRLADTLALSFVAFYPLDYFYISEAFLPATVHFIFFLLVCKVLTARSARDFTYLKLLAALELLAAAVLSTSLSFFAFLALFMLFAIASFSSGEVRSSTQKHRTVVREGLRAFPRRLGVLAVFLFTGILTMTAALFFVLPRTARAALERFVPQRYHLPGFSNEVMLGQIGEIKQSSVPIMHIHKERGEGFRGEGNRGEGMLDVRWRGAALTEFDGKRWSNPVGGGEEIHVPPDKHQVVLRFERPPRRGQWVVYTVQLSEMTFDSLFYAGSLQSVSINAPLLNYTPGGALRVPRGPTSGLKYQASSVIEEEYATPRTPPEPLGPIERDRLLLLPDNLDVRIFRLAREVVEGATSGFGADDAKARAIAKYLRTNYGYTLHLLPATVPDPLANFLFERRKGHCEYFASAMAVMLRTVGIPSRVVTGFTSGVYNPLTGWQVVRASDAHSWVEAWIPGRGWITYDPTPPDPNAVESQFMTRVSLFFDAAEQFWQDWILSYDLERQITLASRVQQSGRGAKGRWLDRTAGWLAGAARSGAQWGSTYAPAAAVAMALAILAVLFGPGLVRWWRGAMRVRRLKRGEGEASDATLLYQRMLGLLERRGIQKPPWLTPSEFVRVMPATELSPLVEDLTSAYVEFRFGGKRASAPRMVELLDQLEKM
jgi:transglutaminase-like putative cysteine protease